jgi:hypothetical protein
VLEAVRTSQGVYGNGKQVRDLESDVMLVERPA